MQIIIAAASLWLVGLLWHDLRYRSQGFGGTTKCRRGWCSMFHWVIQSQIYRLKFSPGSKKLATFCVLCCIVYQICFCYVFVLKTCIIRRMCKFRKRFPFLICVVKCFASHVRHAHLPAPDSGGLSGARLCGDGDGTTTILGRHQVNQYSRTGACELRICHTFLWKYRKYFANLYLLICRIFSLSLIVFHCECFCVFGWQAERQAVNTTVQGSAADLVKKAMIDIDAALRHAFAQCRTPITYQQPGTSYSKNGSI